LPRLLGGEKLLELWETPLCQVTHPAQGGLPHSQTCITAVLPRKKITCNARASSACENAVRDIVVCNNAVSALCDSLARVCVCA